MYPSFQEVIDRLSVVEAPVEPLPSKRAAVAISVRSGVSGPEILMIQRAVRQGDPWSGHMGFPGGRKDESAASEEDPELEALRRNSRGFLRGLPPLEQEVAPDARPD